MIEIFVKNTRLLVLLIALIIVAGMASLHVLPRTEDPSMINRAASVITTFPGASAERVEALVTEKIEQKLQKLSEIEYLASTSRPEISVIQVKLEGFVKDSDPVFTRIRDLLNDVRMELPAGSLDPVLEDERSYAFTQLIALNWVGLGDSDVLIMSRYAKELKAQLLLVPDTDIVEVYGENPEEILVEVNQDQAATAGISLQQISQAIAKADVKVSAGKLVNRTNQLQIELKGALDSLDRIRDIPITSSQNTPIKVGDIANVKRQVREPKTEMAIINGQPALVVATRMVKNSRVDLWSRAVNEQVAKFNTQLPSSIETESLFDQNTYTETRLTDLVNNIIIGFVLIAAVLFFTLGTRSALVVVFSLPLTVLFTLSVMNFYGLPIHQMSVTGLVVALGIMVDNAIVMTDTIQQKKQQGIKGIVAVVESIKHLWLPLLGSTATTVLAFMPIVLMPGDAGDFVGGIALSVIFALIGSFIISHTIIPGLAGRLIKINKGEYHWYQQGVQFPRLDAWFKKSLAFTFTSPRITIALVFILPIVGFNVAKHLDEQFFPASDRDMFQIELFLSPHGSLQATYDATNDISASLAKFDEIKSLQWFIGKSAPSFYYNLISNKDGMKNYAQAMVSAVDFEAANQLIPQLQEYLDMQFPKAQILVRKLEQGPPFNAPIEIRIFGPNLDTLKQLGEQLRNVFAKTEDIVHSRATLSDATAKAWIRADEDTLNALNLDLASIAKQLEVGLDGVVQGSVVESTESINVRVRTEAHNREQLNQLNNFPVVNPATGEFIPLSAVSEVLIEPSRAAIPHRDGMRVNVIEGYVRAGVLPSVPLNKILQTLEDENITMPTGYRLQVGGESDARNKAVGKLMSSVGIIVTMLITIVVLSFNSFRIASIIFLSAFMSAGLGLLSIYVFNYPFGFNVILGLLGLMGLAINSAIVILAELKSDKEAVKADVNAITKGVLSCTRHISSTTITTVGGFLPLILSGGGMWPPFAVAIAGGTVLTTLLSFYFVPAAFYLLAKRKHFKVSQNY